MTVLYAGLLARAALVGPADQPDRRGRLAPGAGLAGWTHYVVFDLFVGRWIWRTALEEGRGCRLALVLALFAGPLGLLVFDLQRRGAPRRSRA